MGTTHHSKQSLQSHIFTSRLTYSFTLKLHQTLQTLCHSHTISTDLFATHLPKTSKCHPTSNLLSLTQASTTTHMQVAVELATISRPQRPPTAALLAALPLSLSTVSQRASPSSAAAEAEQATSTAHLSVPSSLLMRAATPEDPRGEDEGRSCQVQHRPWRSWQLVYSSPRGISQGPLQLFRQQWQRTKWILRPLEPHPRAPLEHLLLTRYIFLRFSERRSAFHHHHGRHQSSGLVLIPTSFDNDISSSRRNIETSEKSDRRMHHHHHHQHGVHL